MTPPRLTLPLRRLGQVWLGKMLQTTPSSSTQVLAPYLRAAHVQPTGRLVEVENKSMWFEPEELAAHNLRKGDVVIVEGGAGFGRSAVLRETRSNWGFQNSILRFRAHPGLADGRFIDYALQNALACGQIAAACNTATIPHFTADKVSALSVPAPSRATQTAIADYLDRETAQIDTLIEKQLELIESLEDRYTATITARLYEGRNLLASHYAPIQRAFTVTLGKMLDSGRSVDRAGVVLPYLRAANIQDHGLKLDDVNQMPFTKLEMTQLDLRRGDLLVVEGGAIGTCQVLEQDMPGWSFQKTVNRVRSRGKSSTDYLALVLRVCRDAGFLDVVCNKSTIPHLTAEKLESLRVPLPSVSGSSQSTVWSGPGASVPG